jgi:transcriptional regulator EpsA
MNTRAEDTLDPVGLSGDSARALLRVVESAPAVRRRYQFFMWLQTQLQPLLPHQLALCAAYNRHRRQLQFEVFNSIVLPAPLMLQLGSAESPLLQQLVAMWIDGGGEARGLPLDGARGDEALALRAAGVTRLLLHGVSRPDRLHEVSSFFVFGDDGRSASAPGGSATPERLFELVVHALHATYLRTLSFERELGSPQPRSALPMAPLPARAPRVTPREAQILAWVREGKSNLEIGVELGISALTVKNHIQKILRKLGASNRAHAVALAMQSRLIGHETGPGEL